MKASTIFFLLFIFSPELTKAQEVNTIIKDPDLNNKEVMVGMCDRYGLKQGEYGLYFMSQYEVYELASKYIEIIKPKIELVNITIVYGSWCSDSKIQVPRFFKVLDQASFNEDYLTVIGVSRKKLALTTNIEHLDIELVPTFIVYQNGKELGRIIETPKKSLERDLAKIIKKTKL